MHSTESTSDRPVVALDAMGGDYAPSATVEGAVMACRDGIASVLLVGDETRISAELKRLDATDLPIETIHADEVISVADSPARAARTKRGSSMHRCFELVKSGRATAAVSAGNSGAFLAVGLTSVRRLPGCDRPAIATTLPTADSPTVLLDVGATVEARAAHLAQFSAMGAAYATIRHRIQRPRVALLANGTEPTKGTETVREAHRLLTMMDLNYVGFTEARQMVRGEVDVVVTDGFTGNVVLKLCEDVASVLFERIRTGIKADFMASLVSPALRRPLEALRGEFDWENTGGAILLGLNAIAIVAHGRSTPKAIRNSIQRARDYSMMNLNDEISRALADGVPSDQITTSELPASRTTGERQRMDES